MNIFPCEIQQVGNGFIIRASRSSGMVSIDSEIFVFNSLDQMFEWIKDKHTESGVFCPDIK